ncbi:MAG TPA: poly-gamma-glutamate biosynthesis protein [Actinobacteria bacterium]|nr:poly-gamma-glutamate biosynthesis protein [Actinomycetota bacterium]
MGLRIVFVGDVMLGRGVNKVLQQVPPEYVWGDTLDIIREADYSLINLECALTFHEHLWDRTLKAFYFKADPEQAIATLKAANITCACIANNHTLDFQEKGLLDTLQTLDEAGICRAGAGRDIVEARAGVYREVRGFTIGLIAFTDNEPDFAAVSGRPGVNYIPVSPDTPAVKPLLDAVAAAKEKADIVIVSAHWGPNMRFRPPREFRAFAHRLIDAGADIFHGHSAHNFQAIEAYKGKPIFYDTGDFIDDYAVDPIFRNDQSFIFAVDLDGVHIESIDLYPVHLDFAQTNLATGYEFDEIAARMEELSAELGPILFRRAKHKLIVPVRRRRKKRVAGG